MAARNPARRGITVTDVIAIIIVLFLALGLLLSGLKKPRAASRRMACHNKERQLCVAMFMFEQAHGFLPGIANPPQALEYPETERDVQPKGKTSERLLPSNAGYVPLLLPYLYPEGQGVWDKWAAGNRISPRLAVLICPSNNEDEATDSGQLSYIVNDGMAATDGVDKAKIEASGVSFDRTGTLYSPIELSLKYVEDHDGAAHTLLLSENLLANHWNTDNAAAAKRWNSFVWYADPVPAGAEINSQAPATAMTDKSLIYARPSSNHPGGVNVTFCDGRVEFIEQGIDYKVWRQMMVSDRSAFP